MLNPAQYSALWEFWFKSYIPESNGLKRNAYLILFWKGRKFLKPKFSPGLTIMSTVLKKKQILSFELHLTICLQLLLLWLSQKKKKKL